MAVAHSAASESHTGNTGSTNQASFSWTHTQTGTPQGVVVFVSTFVSTANLITSVTYGGVALTRLTGGSAQDGAGEQGRCDAFFLGSGLGTGNQTITVNRTNNATVMYASAATVTAGANTAVPEATIVLLQGDGTLAVQSVDDTSPGVNSVRYAGAYSGLNAPPVAGTGSTLLNSIDIGNYGAALVRETTAGQGARNVGFTGATDDRAAVHLVIRELVPRTETPIVGAFTLTGNPADLTKAGVPKVMDGGTGAFTLTGQAAELRHNPNLEADTGTFTLDGQPADTRHNVQITAETGAFSFTGNPATFTKATPKAIAADRGQFTLTGNDATLRQNYAITAEVGTFTVAGQPATLRHNLRIEANTGSFALTGGEPALLHGRYLSGGAGEFIETGQPATFRRTWALGANAGTFVLTGITPAFTEIGAYEIDPFAGTFALTGQPAQLAQSQSLPVDAGTYSLTGQPAATTVGHAIRGDLGKFFLPERNLRQYSEEFNNAYWTKGNSSITANSTAAPDGTLTADTLIENTANNTHIILRNTSFTAGVKYTASLYVKTYLSRDVAIVLGTTAAFGGAGNTTVVFSPSTNTFLLAVNSPEAYGSEDVGNGWYRIYITKTAVTTAATSSQIQLRIGTTGTYTGDGTSGAYVWGAQLEEGDLTTYDPTGPNSAPLTDIRVAHRLVAETGAFALTGNPATLDQGYRLAGDTGAFSFAGNPAALAKQAITQIGAETGVFAVSGQQVSLKAARLVPTERGLFTLTGQPANLFYAQAVTAQSGVFSLAGQPAVFKSSRSLSAQAGLFTVTGNNANLSDTDRIFADTGAFILTGLSATLAKTSAARRRNVLIF